MAKTKVAILGGGLGSMAAAYELTCTQSLRDRFEVTVYQQGWRLGGKAASGRNQAVSQRIEEHGLHAFLGFYENAFRLMRDLYEDWAHLEPNARWKSWRDAFEPQYLVTIEEWVPRRGGDPERDGRWETWNLRLPRLPGEPGDGRTVPLERKIVHGIAELAIDWLKEIVRAEPRVLAELARDIADIRPSTWRDLVTGRSREALDEVSEALREYEEEGTLDDLVRRLVLGVQLAFAILRGLIDDVLPLGPERGFAYIDQWDFSAWLERHGASRRVSFWGPVRALYDLGFAYPGGAGDRAHARAAAGVSLRILLLLGLGYEDAPLWKMNAGMGDTIFGPLYRVLEDRGVRFEFFKRVTNLGLSQTGNLIQHIDLSRQVNLRVPSYDPLVVVNELPCWPSDPKWDDIVDGPAIRDALAAEGLTLESAWCAESVGVERLTLGQDFDRVVLGISVAALRDVAPELIAERESWRKMIAASQTVQTQALQLWLDRDTHALGFAGPPTIMTGYVEPFDTWGDLSHLLREERWPAAGPRSLAYFCNVLPDAPAIPPYTDHGFPAREHARVFELSKQYLDNHIGHLWPRATRPGDPKALDWARLYDPSGASGIDRLKAQYWRANIDPTERYVLSTPGSIQFRLAAGDCGFLNLVIAGDWIRTSLNAGCAEAAIESGLRAAHALIGDAPRPFHDRRFDDDR
jgi:uncharacterized protein with NAD-binding domain and iron-sulfur cluster